MFEGEGAAELFRNEAGGHRWQRIPPTEKRGRVHTSTVTVAVLAPEKEPDFWINPADIEIRTVRGSGPGGQHRNKTESCVVARHKPTGIEVRIDERSQFKNKSLALKILRTKLACKKEGEEQAKRSQEKHEQVGSGQRGDKIRTYRVRDDLVTDHRTGKKWRLSRWVKGLWR
jgi:peptide chain release factor 1